MRIAPNLTVLVCLTSKGTQKRPGKIDTRPRRGGLRDFIVSGGDVPSRSQIGFIEKLLVSKEVDINIKLRGKFLVRSLALVPRRTKFEQAPKVCFFLA